MTHVYIQRIDELIKSNKLYRFNHELLDVQDKTRIKNIKYILQQQEEYINPVKLSENKIKDHINILRNSQYNKRWQDLKDSQKINRLDKYIKDNNINLEQKYIDILKESINKKTLKSNNIKYDRYGGFITDITIIKNVDGIYELEDMTEKKHVVRKKEVVKKKQ